MESSQKKKKNFLVKKAVGSDKSNTTKISQAELKKSSFIKPQTVTHQTIRKIGKLEPPPVEIWSSKGKTKLKREISISHQNSLKQSNQKLTEAQREILRNKLSGMIDKRYFIRFGIGRLAKDPELPEKNKLENCPWISKVEYDSNISDINKTWKAYSDKIYFHKGSLFFAPESEGAVELTGVVLPNEYEISFSISSSVINGFVEFGVTADQYLPGLYYIEAPSGLNSRYFFRLNGNGRRNIFDSLMFRKQDKKRAEWVSFARIKNVLNTDFYKIHIVMTAKSYRVFCNSNLLYYGPSLFKGGIFNVVYKNIGKNYIQIKDVIIKDIKSVDEGDKGANQEYKLPNS